MLCNRFGRLRGLDRLWSRLGSRDHKRHLPLHRLATGPCPRRRGDDVRANRLTYGRLRHGAARRLGIRLHGDLCHFGYRAGPALRRLLDENGGRCGLSLRLADSGTAFARGSGLFGGELLGGELGGWGRGRRGCLLGPAEGATGAAGWGLHALAHAVSSFISSAYSLSSVGISPKASM
ncbi:hypothetical protein ACH40F_08685 [Streptomyces sp. NPDC020794]|uniref:hypothetical protein n=1 Tax=unclassified Streptomyces TaxID=2593676 RepID=UPI0036EE02B6